MRHRWLAALSLLPLLGGCSGGGGEVCVIVTFDNAGEERVLFRAQAFGPGSSVAVPLAGGAVVQLGPGQARGVGLTSDEIPDGLARVRVFDVDDEVEGNPTEFLVDLPASCGDQVTLEFRADGTVGSPPAR